jgi:Flp pilus assembly protein TadD
LAEYTQVGPGTDYLAAQQRQTEILLGSGRIAEARQRLAEARKRQSEYAVPLYLLEVEGLASADQTALADETVQQALQQHPNDLNLLYVRSMLAEKRGDLGQLESDLRYIIAHDPDNAMALNALGYTLADRTPRLAEARQLIDKAHQLSPDDPAILDSMGWIRYRQGQLADAERYLRQAYERFPDAEVAAHLGEVLWAQGKHSEARKVWRVGLDADADDAILRNTLKRLTGSETLR